MKCYILLDPHSYALSNSAPYGVFWGHIKLWLSVSYAGKYRFVVYTGTHGTNHCEAYVLSALANQTICISLYWNESTKKIEQNQVQLSL